jgi:hypothetical protein
MSRQPPFAVVLLIAVRRGKEYARSGDVRRVAAIGGIPRDLRELRRQRANAWRVGSRVCYPIVSALSDWIARKLLSRRI